MGLQLVCLPLSSHVGRARVATAYTCGAVLDTGHLHKIVFLGDEASEHSKEDVQFLGKNGFIKLNLGFIKLEN